MKTLFSNPVYCFWIEILCKINIIIIIIIIIIIKNLKLSIIEIGKYPMFNKNLSGLKFSKS